MAATAPTSTDCVAYWKLEDLLDETGNDNDLTNGGATSGATGILNDGYTFITNKYMTSASTDFDITTFSISLWVKFRTSVADQILMTKGSATSNANWHLFLDVSADSLLFNVYGSGILTVIASPVDGTWYHIGLTCDGPNTTTKAYVNGSYVGQSTNAVLSSVPSGDNLNVGIWVDESLYPFDGVLDEISFFDTLLTADNFEYLYNAGSPGSAQQYPFTAVAADNTLFMGMNF